MTKTQLNRSQAGFTLVELAIVLMIIGLLIGGILRGQELMENARVTSTIQQSKAYDGAVTTFRDAYGSLPGDITNAAARLANCAGGGLCNTPGNGNGLIGPAALATKIGAKNDTLATENRTFWTHLATARLISGINATSLAPNGTWGDQFPAGKIGGGFHVVQLNVPAAAPVPAVSGLFLNLRNNAGIGGNLAEGDGISAISPNRASQIDRKLDDGLPNVGDVIGSGTAAATGCYNGNNADSVYNEALEARNCNLLIRVQS